MKLAVARSLERVFRFFHLEPWFRLLVLCVLVGVVAGLGAFAFDRALKFVSDNVLHGWLFETGQSEYPYWALIVIPCVGALLAGLIAHLFAPEARGHGTDAVIRAFHRNKGEIRARVPLIKGLCSILTIGSGGSAGKEGPISQIGAGFGSTLATMLKLSVRDRRLLMLAGVAGGIGAIFKAPLGGALFAAEMLYRDPDFEHNAVIPGVISSVTAYSVFTAIDGYERILHFEGVSEVTFPSVGGTPLELVHYAILSLLCAMVAFIFVKILKLLEKKVFDPLPAPRLLKPALGGAAVGALAMILMLSISPIVIPGQTLGASHPSHIMSGGYGYLQNVIDSALDTTQTDPMISLKIAAFLFVVVLAKMIATGFTIGSGGSGGLLFPALFLGGLTGAAYAKLQRAMDEAGWIPHSLAMTPGARAGMILVGMGGVFAACTKTPIASLVMVSEITGS
ncbi:MAG TPA: chloride channel protein, partial [Planctomycetota bacterium]|nr:chloride channel protein [Planctomycetota bacterium]